jgi:uncharacterized protein
VNTSNKNLNVFKVLLLWLIRFYQIFFSGWLPGSCRFTPSCSAYALEAVELHGVIKGIYLIFKRLIYCNPFCKGGLDFVPPKNPLSKN